jgi:hypothetical protein
MKNILTKIINTLISTVIIFALLFVTSLVLGVIAILAIEGAKLIYTVQHLIHSLFN